MACLNDGLGNEKGQLAALHKRGQQQSVFRPEGEWIENAVVSVYRRPPIANPEVFKYRNAAIGLKHVIL